PDSQAAANRRAVRFPGAVRRLKRFRGVVMRRAKESSSVGARLSLFVVLGALGCDGASVADAGLTDAYVPDAHVGDTGVDPEDGGAMSDAGVDGGGCFDESCVVRFDALDLLSDPY